MNETNDPLRERINQTRSRTLDIIDNILDGMNPPPALPAPPRAVTRRLVANSLGLWQFCANSKCKRGQCCRGEPLHCLRYAMPLLPPGTLDEMLRRRPRYRRPVNQPIASSTMPASPDTMPCL